MTPVTPVDFEILLTFVVLLYAFRLNVLLNLVGKFLYKRAVLAYLDWHAKKGQQ
jgi:hypothetical protein